MTNDETRMNDEAKMTNFSIQSCPGFEARYGVNEPMIAQHDGFSDFVIRISFVIRHSSFVIATTP